MSEVVLPEGWETCSLNLLAKFIDYRGKTPKKKGSGIPLITAKNIRDGYINREPREYISEEDYDDWMTRGIPRLGDVLITTEAPMGNVATIDIQEKFALAQRAICLQFYVHEMSVFGHYALRSPTFQAKLKVNATGTTVSGIKAATLKSLGLPVPPLEEQKEIAARLDDLLAQVDSIKTRLDAIPAILKRFRQSVLATAVSGKLIEQDSVRELCLDDVASFQNGFAFKSGWFEGSGEYQVLKLGNIRDGHLALDNSPAFLNENVAADYLRFTPQKGDTLLSMTGTRFKRDYGFGCMIKNESNLLINQRVGRLIPNQNHVLPEYLNIFVRSDKFRDQFFKGETGGVNQGNVGSKHIMSIPINVPSLDEQTEIVCNVEQLLTFADQIEKQVKNAQTRVNNLTQSVLAQAFRGELTAGWREQYPELIRAENSAQALLEKIKVQQAELTKTSRKKRTKKS